MHWWVQSPINALSGWCWFFVCVGLRPCAAVGSVCLFCFAWEDTYIWPGDVHFLPTLVWKVFHLPLALYSFTETELVSAFDLFLLSSIFGTVPLSLIGQTPRQKKHSFDEVKQ